MPTFKEKPTQDKPIAASKSTTSVKQSLCQYFAVSAYVFFFAAAMGQDQAFAFCDCWPAPPAWPPPPSSSIAAMNGRRGYRQRRSKVGRTTARSDQIRLGDGDVAAA
ncbi:hypothetical protein QA641_35775 [Bradyrhizobium sp. CB1650]|uniref:hypothetical protein n=1 Tax=Bradyrhizobium sp. CB1650 TaxID=3039153 RepID=UPI0024353613|nr:hypothetical protein [Bradyrhizobium sp. CB1650]WGD50893.1 hypothetical protein QA641_35775 [Bradyrhizobium sp. CB1650]